MNDNEHPIDPAASEAGKLEGMENAEKGAPNGWIELAIETIRWLALRYPFLIADDVWARGLEHPGEARALGPCFKMAQKLGLIEPTVQFVKTGQVKRHRSPVMVWRSLLLGGAPVEFHPNGLYSQMGQPKTVGAEIDEMLTALADEVLTTKVCEYLAKTPDGLAATHTRLTEILRERRGNELRGTP
jgi:hypothetical protein